MTSFVHRLKSIFTRHTSAAEPAHGAICDPLDYEKLVALDAEELAEQGILAAYLELLPTLKQYAGSPIELAEDINNDEASYSVSAAGQRFQIWDAGAKNADAWERATVAFFTIVNANLQASSHKFYALYGGNDLGGMFLTEDEVAAARKAHHRRSNWPWLPVNVPPHFGYPIEQST